MWLAGIDVLLNKYVGQMEKKDRYALLLALVGCLTGVISLSWQFLDFYASFKEKVHVGYSYLSWSEDTVCFTLDVRNDGRKPIYLDEVLLKFGSESKGLIWSPSSIVLYGGEHESSSGLDAIQPNDMRRFFYKELIPASDNDIQRMYQESKKGWRKGWSVPQPYIVVKTSKERHLFDWADAEAVMTVIKNAERITEANKSIQETPVDAPD